MGLDSFVILRINQMEQAIFQKLIEEFKNLNEKINNLRDFLLSDKSKDIDNLNKDLLITQLKVMESYLSILSIRIGLNSDNENNVEKFQDA